MLCCSSWLCGRAIPPDLPPSALMQIGKAGSAAPNAVDCSSKKSRNLCHRYRHRHSCDQAAQSCSRSGSGSGSGMRILHYVQQTLPAAQPMRGTPLSRFARIQRLQRHADTRLKHSNFYCAVKCSCSAATLRRGLCSFLPRTVPMQDIAMDGLISRAVAIARIVADCSQVSAERLLLCDRHHRQQFKQRPTCCVPSFCECSPLRCARCSLRCRVRPGG